MPQSCDTFEQNGIVARYVAGKATSAEARSFEDHYVECSDCFDKLALASGIRAELRALPVDVVPLQPRRGRRFPGLIIGVGLAAVLSGVLLVRNAADARIEALGAVSEPPAYGGVAVRANDSPADQQFDLGMAAYQAGRYREASTHLNAALEAGIDPLPTEFFLGASMLLLNEPSAAVPWLQRVLGHGDSPYRAEAHYYLAKSLLRLRHAEEALSHLNAAAIEAAPIAARARALADSLNQAMN